MTIRLTAQEILGMKPRFDATALREAGGCIYWAVQAGRHEGLLDVALRNYAALEAETETTADDLRTLQNTLQTHNWCGYNDHIPGKLGRCIVCDAELTEVEEAEAETAGVTG